MKTKQSNNSVATTDAVKIASQRALFNLEWENDTVFKKRELNYKTKTAFQKDLEAGKISKYTTVFIKDSKEIYKNGQYYGSSEGGEVSGLDEISLSQDVINGAISSGNLTESDYNKILAASEKGFIIVVNPDGTKFLSKVSKSTLSEGKIQLNLFIGEVLQYIGNILLTNNITIKDKSENYAFTSNKLITNIYNGSDGHIAINTSTGTEESTEIDLIVNGAGTKFLSDDGQYKTIETISSAVGKIDLNSDGTGEIFNNYEGEDLNISKGNSSHAEGKKTQANSNGSHAEGIETIAGDSSNPKNGKGAHAEGQVTTALGNSSHAEGYNTKALKDRSHAEGYGTKADNQQAHAEGYYTTATGINSHIEGKSTIQAPEDITEATDADTIIEKWDKSTLVHDNKFSLSHGQFSHGEGYDVLALGNYSHAEGSLNIAKGECSHAEGFFNEASGMNSHAEGDQNQASGVNAHAEGSKNVASNENSHAEGQGTIASGKYSHAEGIKTQAIGDGSHAEGDNCIAMGTNSHVEGEKNYAIGTGSHVEGGEYTNNGIISSVTFSDEVAVFNGYQYKCNKDIPTAFKFGGKTYNVLSHFKSNESYCIIIKNKFDTLNKAIDITLIRNYSCIDYSHVEGYRCVAIRSNNYESGDFIGNHAEGYYTESCGEKGSHSEGYKTIASGRSAHSEGNTTIASGNYSHSEGFNSKASGQSSHAEGSKTEASGSDSHAEGYSTKATYNQCHAEGHSSKASGQASHAEGMNTEANGQYSHAEGDASHADGMASHAEGIFTIAYSNASHAEGSETEAYGRNSHAEGNSSEAHGNSSHAEGVSTKSIGDTSHAEGDSTISSGDNSHAEGRKTESFGTSSHSEGEETLASGNNSHAEGKSELYEENNITIFSVDTETKSIICSRTFENKIGCYLSFNISNKVYRINKYEFISDEQRKITLDSVEGLSENELCYYKLYSLVAKGDCSHAEGIDTISSGIASHSEGHNTNATGDYSHTEGKDTSSSGMYSHAEGVNTRSKGEASHAEGRDSYAEGMNAHAEGYWSHASGDGSHAEGSSKASGWYSHAEGSSESSGSSSHSEGSNTKAIGDSSHAEGYYTVASGNAAHVEGYYTIASGEYSHAEGHNTEASGHYSHVEGQNSKSSGDFSHSEGYSTKATAPTSHSEGSNTIARGQSSHVEGQNGTAIGNYSHAEGYNVLTLGEYSHAEGGGAVKLNESFYAKTKDEILAEWERLYKTPTDYETGDGFLCAAGKGSHSEGKNTLALADFSHTSGEATVAKSYCQTAIGRFNEPTTSGYNEFSISNEAFVIGNGTDINSKGNAFKVLFNGQTYADGAYSGSGADYAEFFEWKDGNESNEDRVGLFVSIENDKIVKATKDSKYILGIVSGNPSVIGDNPMRWKNKYLTDKFGRPIYEEVEVKKYEKRINDNGEEEVIEIIEKQKTFKINPEWDSSKEYISRESRKEWSAIGLMGKLIVRHDGTLKQGGFCYPSENGIATNSETGYYVMKVYEDTALIMFK